MNERDIIQKTTDHVRGLLSGEGSGHDWFHIERVRNVALTIAREEKADLFVVELTALLHDVADWKFAGGDHDAGPRAAREWLASFDVPTATIDHVANIIASLSFKGAGVETPMSTIEGQCVQDADRLDAIGAIGIARAFAYGGHKGRAMYDPAIPPEPHASFEAYKKNSGPTINHFYEKLLLLKDRMNTATGKWLAAGRHDFMDVFLDEFMDEWSGEVEGVKARHFKHSLSDRMWQLGCSIIIIVIIMGFVNGLLTITSFFYGKALVQ